MLEYEDNLDPKELLDAARAALRAGRYADSLQKFQIFHDVSRRDRSMGPVRKSFALSDWLRLASLFPPAFDALVDLRNNLEDECRINQGDYGTFSDIRAINRRFNDNRRTLALFDELVAANPACGESLYRTVEPLLVAEERFADCSPYLHWEQQLESATSCYQFGLLHESRYEGQALQPPKLARKHFQIAISLLTTLLVRNHRRADAASVREKALAVLDDEEFRQSLDASLDGKMPEFD